MNRPRHEPPPGEGDTAQALQRLRESEARFRTLFEGMGEGFFLCELVYGADGEVADVRYVAENPVARETVGFASQGKLLSELNPAFERDWLAILGRVAASRQAERFERYSPLTGLWVDYHVFPALTAPDQVGVLFRDISERREAEAELRESEERYRLIVESARDYAIFVADPDDRIVDWLPGAEAVFGWRAEEVLGRPAQIVFTPEDRARGEPEKELATASREGVAPDVRWHQRKDGSRVFLDGIVTTLRNDDGSVRAYLKIGQDITERRLAQDALRDSEERLRQFGEASQDVLWIRECDTLQWTYLTPAFETIYGLPREDALAGDNYRNWFELIEPQDRELARASIERVRRGEHVTFEYRIRRPDGEIRWLRNTDFPIRDAEGKVTRFGGIGTDITERKRHEERQQTLLSELQHRVRNILFVIRSVFTRTLEGGGSVEEVAEHFHGRLDALARTQVVVTQNPRRTADLEILVREELLSVGVGAGDADGVLLSLEGPDVELPTEAAEALGLAVHELTTNAIKYGALRFPGASLAIRWSVNLNYGAIPRLVFSWEEQGVPAIAVDPGREGFGTELITRALPYRLGAETALELRPGGVHCTIELPLTETAPWRGRG